MILFLIILGYLLGAFGSLVFQKCAQMWNTYDNGQNIVGVVVWPVAIVVMVIYVVGIQLNRLSDVVVAKLCPNKTHE